jgi:uncharacterized membrane protein YfcA
MAEWGAYLGIGAAVGFLAGLLGIGGGTIIVSSLALMFAHQGFPPEYAMHCAVGTSLAAIVAGAWGSFRAHDRRGAVDWPVVRSMLPGLLGGVLAGALVARLMRPGFLKYFFLGFITLIALQMIFNVKPKASRDLPGRGGLVAMGAVIGVCSSWFGGGAAAVGVPFLTWCNVSAHRAIGTVAALAFPTSLAGAIGYAASGYGAPGLPPWSVGFVYLPAAIGISVASLALAPLGARLAHRMSGPTLRRVFALFILAVGVKVALSA